MTLADIIPSLRGSLPRTLDKDLWPATVRHLPGGDVSVAGVSLVEIAARQTAQRNKRRFYLSKHCFGKNAR